MSGPIPIGIAREIRGLSDAALSERVREVRAGAQTPISYPVAKEIEDEYERRKLIRLRDARAIIDGRVGQARRDGLLPEEEAVIVSHVADNAVRATVRNKDPMQTFDCGFDASGGWWCLCPTARSDGDCRHLVLLRQVTEGIAGPPRDDREEGSA